MKNILILLWPLIFIISCGSLKKDESHLTEKDFIPPRPKIFSRNSDFLSENLSGAGVLRGESMDKSPSRSLSYFDSNENPLDKALSLCYRKKFSKADKKFKVLYRAYKKHRVYWNYLGTCELIKGHQRRALLFYNKSKDLAPKYGPPLNNLGVLYQLDGKDQKALAAYKKASQMSSFSFTPLLNLGQLYTKYGLIDKAKRIFNSLLRRDENDIDVLSALAYLHLVDGDYQKAVNLYSQMDKSVYRSVAIGINLALALYLSNKKKDAEGVWDNIYSPKNKREKAYYQRAKQFFRGKL